MTALSLRPIKGMMILSPPPLRGRLRGGPPTPYASAKSASQTPHQHPSSPTKSSTSLYLDLVGPGTGLDDAGVQHKLAVLTRSANRTPTPLDAESALTQYGGFEIAMMTAAIIAAANAKRLVIIDGFIATSAAIAAINTDSTITNALLFSHRSGERGHDAMLKALNAKPLLDLDMRLGEGTGALLAWPIIKAAAAILNNMATFQSANVSDKTMMRTTPLSQKANKGARDGARNAVERGMPHLSFPRRRESIPPFVKRKGVRGYARGRGRRHPCHP